MNAFLPLVLSLLPTASATGGFPTCSDACVIHYGSGTLNDEDCDGWIDGEDNCPFVANDQIDSDGDGDGDPCDGVLDVPVCSTVCVYHLVGGDANDSDCDGWLDTDDNCDDVQNEQTDSDGDLEGDACDACPALHSGTPDTDSDCIADSAEDSGCVGGVEDYALFTDTSDGCPSPCAPGDYDDAFEGYPDPVQPADGWQWGYIDGSDTFQVSTFKGPVTGSGGPSDALLNWRISNGSTDTPQVVINPTGSTILYNNTFYYPAPSITLVPEASGEDAAVQFVAPDDGVYALTYNFRPARGNIAPNFFPTNAHAYVTIDRTGGDYALADGDVTGFDTAPVLTLSGTADLYLTAGEKVVFRVHAVTAPNVRYTVRLDAEVQGTCP